MKKLFLLLLCCPVMLPAQSKITISGFSVKPGTPSTVTFTVSWNKDKIDSAWVFVDYNNSGTMTRLPLSGATASAGSRAYMLDGNDQGAWVVAGASGAFSATVQLVATCTDARPCVPTGACVYAIDYPPVGKYTGADKITFTGTPPFYLEFTDGSTATVSAKTEGSYTYNIGSKKLKSFTDASRAPGILKCALPAAQTLTVSAAGYCADAAGVQFALSGTESGATYQLIKDNTTVAATLAGTGGAATFSGAHQSGTYSAKTVAGAYCEVAMSGTHMVAAYDKPTISTTPPSTICYNATAGLTASVTAGATANMTYTWNIGGTSGTTTAANKTSQNLTGSTTYTVSVRNANGCVSAVSPPATITVAASFTQSSLSAATICYNTTNTFSLAAASGGIGNITYKWQQSTNNSTWADATGTNTGAAYTTPNLSTNTYYRRVAYNSCGTITTGSALVTVKPTPTITLASGSANQTKAQGQAIEAIQYTTDHATGVTLGGSLPSGVSGSWSNSIYTISGTISASAATQTYSYTVTPTHKESITCSGSSLPGAVTVSVYNTSTPPYAISNKAIIIVNRVWSDWINYKPTECTLKTTNITSSTTPYYYAAAVPGSIYNLACLSKIKLKLCPSPWRLPSANDLASAEENITYLTLPYTTGIGYQGNYYTEWTTIVHEPLDHSLSYFMGELQSINGNMDPLAATAVRCVKDL